MADSPNNTAGSVHVPGPIGAINTKQTPSQTQPQQQRPAWLRQHQPSRKPASGGAK